MRRTRFGPLSPEVQGAQGLKYRARSTGPEVQVARSTGPEVQGRQKYRAPEVQARQLSPAGFVTPSFCSDMGTLV